VAVQLVQLVQRVQRVAELPVAHPVRRARYLTLTPPFQLLNLSTLRGGLLESDGCKEELRRRNSGSDSGGGGLS